MTWVLLVVVVYLLVGLRFAFRGRLAFMVNIQVALLDMHGPIPQWKKSAFKFALRMGVMLFYPVFLVWG
jgi:hypothetical protein